MVGNILDETIHLFTDGACSGNPGPAGIGVLLRYKGHEKQLSVYLGPATNNIAELEAIKQGLLMLKTQDKLVKVYTDSQYAIGLLSKGWNASKNQDLVQEIREIVAKFKKIEFIKVSGHSGHPENEITDKLAVAAYKNR